MKPGPAPPEHGGEGLPRPAPNNAARAARLRRKVARLSKELAACRGGEAQELLQAVFQHSPDAIMVADDSARYVAANPAAEELTGYARHELTAMGIHDISDGLSKAEFWAMWRRFLGQKSMRGRFPLRRKDGRSVLAEFHAVADITPGRHLSLLSDVTAVQATENALRRSEELFRTLAENFPDIIARFDRDLRHIYVSPAMAKYTDRPLEHFLGKSNREMGDYPDELVDQWDEALRGVMATGQPTTIEFVAPSDTGPRHFHSVIAPELGQDGQVRSLLSVARDASDLILAREGMAEYRMLVEGAQIGRAHV